MNRKKKIILYLGFIVILLGVHMLWQHYKSDYYFSLEKCIKNSIRASQFEEYNIVDQFEIEDRILVVLTDEEKGIAADLEIREEGMRYRLLGTAYDVPLFGEAAINKLLIHIGEQEYLEILHRNNEAVEKVDVIFSDGSKIEIKYWDENIAYYKTSYGEQLNGIKYKTFDANGNLIEIIDGDEVVYVEDEFKEVERVTEASLFKIDVNQESVTKSGFEYTVSSETARFFIQPYDFVIQRYIKGDWIQVQPLINYVINDVGGPEQKEFTYEVDLSKFYEELPSGKYRIVSVIWYKQKEYIAAGEFFVN